MNILPQFDAALTPELRAALSRLLDCADEQHVALYLVGGAVRDLLLGRGNFDLDVVVEGPVAPLAEALAAALGSAAGARSIHHASFETASVSGPGLRIDLARSRSETYARPGALPTVRPAGLNADLARRDFTINAMALRLAPEAGEIIDPFGGRADLDSGLLRALHDDSFRDDATRILRGLRYAGRLGFEFEPKTLSLVRRDIEYLGVISGARLRHEIELALKEECSVDIFWDASELGALAAVDLRLDLTAETAERWRNALAGVHFGAADLLGWAMLSRCEDAADVTGLAGRLGLTARIRQVLLDSVRLRDLSDKLSAPETGPADAAELLDPLAAEAVWATSVREGPAAGICSLYLSSWQKARPALKGDDLLKMGFPPGPRIGEVLRLLRRARIEGRVATRAAEAELVRSLPGSVL